MKAIIRFFDKLEDVIRIHLSHYPIVYALIGAVGVILVWKGIWESAEYFPELFGPMSILIGVVILLATGLLVSFFIGDTIIISGYKKEKKLVEKTQDEVRYEEGAIERIEGELTKIEEKLDDLTASKATPNRSIGE